MKSADAVIASHRFGLGPLPGELKTIGGDARDWLTAQLDKPAPASHAFDGLPDTGKVLQMLPIQKQLPDAMAKDDGAKPDPATDPAARAAGKRRSYIEDVLAAESWARFRAASTTPQPFRERLVRFWSNHFTVSAAKRSARPLAGAFEREAIRPHVTGRFEDLLFAAVRHPAMQRYLDNDRSIGPNSKAGTKHDRGLNENLGREVLELHTLGVDGGYTQADVTAFATALTGWGIDFRNVANGTAGFGFQPQRHEPGPRTILGKSYPQPGEDQAAAVLRDLARAPATAHFCSTKLVRHFVADEPPADAVEKIATVWRSSDGDLGAVSRALVALPQAWSGAGSKFKPPEEFLIGAQRVLADRGGLTKPQALLDALAAMGQSPFMAPSPAGWPDLAAAWLTGDALWKRIEVALALSEPLRSLHPLDLATDAVGKDLGETTRSAIAGAASEQQGLALVLASPEFNRR